MTYLLLLYLPQRLPITLKKNFKSLTGLVMSSCYYFSIEDYNSINITINGIIETINTIISGSYFNNMNSNIQQQKNLNFSSSDEIKKTVDDLVLSNLVYIKKVNGKTEFTDNNVNILTSFFINDEFYSYTEYNSGVIVIPGQLIPSGDYVNSFNNKTGNVFGLSGLTIGNTSYFPNLNGLMKLNLVSRDLIFVNSINGKYGAVTGILSSIDGNIVSLKEIDLNDQYIKNENDNYIFFLTLKNVVTNNTKSAFNIKYMQDLAEKNISKREHLYLQKNKQKIVYLPLNVYPLHFYNEDGGEIVNDGITWTYEKYEENQNKITIVNTQTTINVTMTTIKVY